MFGATPKGSLIVGWGNNNTSSGTMNLGGAAEVLVPGSGLYVGASGGVGTVNQSGESTFVQAETLDFDFGGNKASSGYYNLNGGTLSLGAGGIMMGVGGTSTLVGAVGELIFSGGTLMNSATTTNLTISSIPTAASSGLYVILSGNGYLNPNGGSITVNLPMSGAGGLGITGAGTVTLGGANSYAGGTSLYVNNNMLLQGAANALSSGSIIYQGNSINTMVSLGGLNASIGGLNGGYAGGTVNMGAGSLTITGGGVGASSTYGGYIAGTGGLNWNSSGVLTLAGNNAYTGATNINSGAMLYLPTSPLNNSSALSVNYGATLMGSGTIGGLVTVNGGIIAPGPNGGGGVGNTGWFNFSNAGNFTLTGGTLDFSVFDLTDVDSAATAGVLNLTNLTGAGRTALEVNTTATATSLDSANLTLFTFMTPSYTLATSNFSLIAPPMNYRWTVIDTGADTVGAIALDFTSANQSLLFLPTTTGVLNTHISSVGLQLTGGLAVMNSGLDIGVASGQGNLGTNAISFSPTSTALVAPSESANLAALWSDSAAGYHVGQLNITNLSNPSDSAQPTQQVISGGVYRLAAGTATTTINFGYYHSGQTLPATATSAITVGNMVPNDNYSEYLDVSSAALTGASFAVTGASIQLAPSGTDSTTFNVAMNASAIAGSGSLVLGYSSDGYNSSNLGTTVLPSQTILLYGGIYTGSGHWLGGSGNWSNFPSWDSGGRPRSGRHLRRRGHLQRCRRRGQP